MTAHCLLWVLCYLVLPQLEDLVRVLLGEVQLRPPNTRRPRVGALRPMVLETAARWRETPCLHTGHLKRSQRWLSTLLRPSVLEMVTWWRGMPWVAQRVV